MPDLNRVMLMGNLTRDPEIRYTPQGTPIGELSLAVNESYKAQDGTVKESVLYVDIEVWGRQAETCKQYLQKGRPVFVEGRLRLDQWETPQGEKKNKLRVRADRVQFLGSGSGGGGGGGRGPQQGGYGEERPAPPTVRETTRQTRPLPAANSDEGPPRDDDDIPF
jgi:single-strand DNA-binding protein